MSSINSFNLWSKCFHVSSVIFLNVLTHQSLSHSSLIGKSTNTLKPLAWFIPVDKSHNLGSIPVNNRPPRLTWNPTLYKSFVSPNNSVSLSTCSFSKKHAFNGKQYSSFILNFFSENIFSPVLFLYTYIILSNVGTGIQPNVKSFGSIIISHISLFLLILLNNFHTPEFLYKPCIKCDNSIKVLLLFFLFKSDISNIVPRPLIKS